MIRGSPLQGNDASLADSLYLLYICHDAIRVLAAPEETTLCINSANILLPIHLIHITAFILTTMSQQKYFPDVRLAIYRVNYHSRPDQNYFSNIFVHLCLSTGWFIKTSFYSSHCISENEDLSDSDSPCKFRLKLKKNISIIAAARSRLLVGVFIVFVNINQLISRSM